MMQNKQKVTITLLAIALIAFGSTISYAQDSSRSSDRQPGFGRGPRPGIGERRPPKGEDPFKKIDADSDGSVSSDEFKAWGQNHPHPRRSEEPEQLFDKLDQDGDGALSSDEMRPKDRHPGPRHSGEASSSVQL